MSAALHILAAGPGATIQDHGRTGYLRVGVTAAGPMDPLALATANLAVGNAGGASALEVALGGITLAAEGGPITLAVAGGAFNVDLDGQVFPAPLVITLDPGAKLTVKAGTSGAWCYVAVSGGLDIAPVLGSTATHTRSFIGGLNGNPLKAGDIIPLAAAGEGRTVPSGLVAPWLERSPDTVRVVLGPQDDFFSPEEIAAFLSRPWTLSARSDRMAYNLDGAPLKHLKGYNIVSDGIAQGAIQVPGAGIPIVLMADRQSTGGYPKIANVIGADLGTFAQMRPGTSFHFKAVSLDEAVAARRAQAEALARPVERVPFIRTHLPSDFLLGLNLVGGWVDALAPLDQTAA